MPRKRSVKGKQDGAQVCGKRINYAKLKVDEKVQDGSFLIAARESQGAPGHQLSRTAEEHQGQGLTDAPVRPIAPPGRWAGVLMCEKEFENAPDLASALGIAVKRNGKATYSIDYERYRPLFDDEDISDEQKDQMIEALVLIGNEFYDRGFSYEFASGPCGKLEERLDDSPPGERGVLSCEAVTLTEKFNLCAAE